MLGHVGLILVTLATAQWACCAFQRGREREADELAAAAMGTVVPLLLGARGVSRAGWWHVLSSCWRCYPTRRPWLYRMAAQELWEALRADVLRHEPA